MELSKKTVKRILLIISFTVLLVWGLYNHEQLGKLLSGIYAVISPFIAGLCIAYIVNVLLRALERTWIRLLSKKKKPWPKKLMRPICLLLSIMLVIGIILAIVLIILPELKESVGSLIEMLPTYAEEVRGWWISLSGFLEQYSIELPEYDFKPDKIIDILTKGGTTLFNTTASVAGSIVAAVANFVIAFVFSIYVLAQKETLKRQANKVLDAVLSREKKQKLMKLLTLTDQTFTNFITGQLTEAVIIGALCFVGMAIFKMPYAPAISVLVGFTALIPVFGAFIGTAVGAFLILLVNPLQALWFIVFIIVLQQLEGNLIYPKVVGKSVGLPGIWVLVAVTVGGNAMGIVGMLISVPIFAVLYVVTREAVNDRLRIKGIKR